MKKLLWIAGAMLLAVPAFAQLEQGQYIISNRFGLGFQLQNSGITYNNAGSRTDWGTFGGDVAVSYHYLFTEYFGFGAEVSTGNFDGGDFTFNRSDKIEDKVRLTNLMLTARYILNPTKRVRFYIPFGAGLAIAKQNLDIKYGGNDYTKKKTDNSFSWFAGLGVEFDLGHQGWSLGLESRYAAFWYDTDKLTQGAPGAIRGDGTRRYDYMMFTFAISKRF